MKLGVVGLPNVGKSTLFNALTKAGALSANYPFATIQPNIGIVTVPDARVDFLAKHYQTKSVVHATIQFVDIAGLVKGASQGEGLGNKFLANIRECDAIVHVVRAFDKSEVIHVDGEVNPIRDIQTINLELILSDLESVAKRIEKVAKQSKSGIKDHVFELELLHKIKTVLENEQPATALEMTPNEEALAKSFFLLTTKPVIYCANLDEQDLGNGGESNPYFKQIQELALLQGNKVVGVCAKIEEEISSIESEEEKTELLDMFNLASSGLDKLVAASYDLLGLISFLTAGEPEVRAWTVTAGTRAPQAAGKIHTDFERGFIRAEVVSFDDFVQYNGLVKAKEAGRVRSEGKDYVIADGDIVLFRFNV